MITVLTRRLVVGGFFPLLLVVAGCTDNDRYVFVGPEQPGSLVGEDGGTLSLVPLPSLENIQREDPVVGTADDLVAGDSWRSIRVRGDRFTVSLWPGPSDLRGLARDRAGTVWGLGAEGLVARLAQGTWTPVDQLPGDGFRLLLCDGEDRLVACGKEGRVWRRDGGGWQRLAPPHRPDFTAGWSGPGQVLVLAGAEEDTFTVLMLDDKGWRTSLRLTVERIRGGFYFAASDTGRMLVADRREPLLAVKRGAAWEWVMAPSYWISAFFDDGVLHLGRYGEVLRREGDGWTESDLGAFDPERVVPTPDGPLLVDDGGGRLLWSAGGAVAAARGLLDAVGFAETGPGALHSVHEGGSVLRRDGDGWLRVACLFGCDGDEGGPRVNVAASDAAGRIAIGTSRGLCVYDGTRLSWDGAVAAVSALHRQADGSLLAWGTDTVWRLGAGAAEPVATLPFDNPYVVTDVALHGQRLHVLTRDALHVLEDGVAVPLVAFADQNPGQLLSDPVRGLLVAGDGLLAWRDGAMVDLGPRRTATVRLEHGVPDGRGGYLFFDGVRRELVHYDGAWTLLNPPGQLSAESLQRLADGRFAAWIPEAVWILEPRLP